MSQGYCDAHWYRKKTYGSPYGGRTPPGAPLAFLEMAVAYEGDDCLLWPYSAGPATSSPTGHGYGRLSIDGVITLAHREVLRRAKGEPPRPDMDACHDPNVCTSSLCVNPRHLRWGSRLTNVADMNVSGTRTRGEECSFTRLTRQQVREIYVDPRDFREIAAEYGTTKEYVSKIKRDLARAADTADLTPVRGKRSGDRHPRSKNYVPPESGAVVADTTRRSSIPIEVRMAVADDGRPHREIAEQYGISQAAVSRIQSEAGHSRRKRLTVTQGQRILDRLVAGEPVREVAAAFGVSRDTVARVKDGVTFPELDRSKLDVAPKRYRRKAT
jgi:uncharacterized protein YerC